MPLETTTVILDCPQNARDSPGCILKMSAKRYYTRESMNHFKGLTLLFAHCVGGHKEQWEPTIERIFELRHSQVFEAWTFDWQTHGDSAILNQEVLKTSPSRVYGVCTAAEWSEAIAAFARSPRMQGRHIVLIAHSAGAGAMVLATKNHSISYTAMILVEPTIISPELFYRQVDERVATMEFAVTLTLTRRERWKSRQDAYAWLARRLPWDSWDPRALRKFTDHGLADVPDGTVMIKTDRRHEALSYTDTESHFAAAAELGKISKMIPVHFIWGTENPLVPHFVQEALADGTDGRKAASVTRVKGGHLLVQEEPDRLSDAICAILDTLPGEHDSRARHRSRL
ncbi:Alpha/beta hydrolase fold-1 [Mycena pura]|uniref:Alpha/beta hydrolase fold-1 n=1 Tax=Mycena pura TaxID=153505 RepID=A0AAD6YFL5_9AGAR|nr:Alpha/beta hydrolase fold-1 [Mycena pura]